MPHSCTIYSTYFTDVEDGELVDPYTDESVEDLEPDKWDREDELTSVDLAVKLLLDKGITEPSCYPLTLDNCGHIWFSNPDGSYIVDYGTGEQCQESAHFSGFTPEEIYGIAVGVGARVA